MNLVSVLPIATVYILRNLLNKIVQIFSNCPILTFLGANPSLLTIITYKGQSDNEEHLIYIVIVLLAIHTNKLLIQTHKILFCIAFFKKKIKSVAHIQF